MRTLRSSNGLSVVFIEIQRPPVDGDSSSWLLLWSIACLSTSGGGEKSPVAIERPSRILRDATPVSPLPITFSISSTYAGL